MVPASRRPRPRGELVGLDAAAGGRCEDGRWQVRGRPVAGARTAARSAAPNARDCPRPRAPARRAPECPGVRLPHRSCGLAQVG